MARTSGKTNSFLLEIILTILFFAISSAVILQLFSSAYLIQKQSTAENQALLYAQSLAEEWKASAPQLLASSAETNREHYLNQNWQETEKADAVYTAQIKANGQHKAAGTLYSATVSVFSCGKKSTLLCQIPATVYLSAEGGVAS